MLTLLVLTAVGFSWGAQSGSLPSQVEGMTQNLIDLSARYQRAAISEKHELLSDLLSFAITRRDYLLALMQTNPAEILRHAVPTPIRANMPATVQVYVEEEVEIEGELEIIHEDGYQGSRYLYFLRLGAERLSLHFVTKPSTDLLTGSRIRVKGVRIGEDIAL